MKIIFTGDFLYNSKEHNDKYSLWMFKIFYPIIKDCLSENVEIVFNEIANDKEKFSREKFFALNDIFNLRENYQVYYERELNEKQLNYLSSFFNKDTIVIGFELYNEIPSILTKFGVTVIDFAFHSYKLFDDLLFGISTNKREIYDNLIKYQVKPEQFYYYANYWKTFMQYNNMVKDEKLEDNCAIFVGQTLQDRSVEKDGIYLNISHYEDKLMELKKEYSKIYYLPHPYLWKNCKEFFKYLRHCPYINILKNNTTYGLLASDKVKKVVGISTSVLYEAQYFNKEIEYLYKPLFNIDAPFEAHSYVSVYEDYWNPKFWADILSPVCEIKKDVKNINYFKGTTNKLRNIRDLYWGYKDLDPIKRIPNFEEALKRLYVKYISQLV